MHLSLKVSLDYYLISCKESNSKIMNQLETHFKMGSQGNYFVNNLSKFNKRNKEIRMNRKHLIEEKMQNHKNA